MSVLERSVRTPTVRAWWRRSRFWFVAAGLLIIIAVVSLVVNGTRSAGEPLDPSNPSPIGAKAVAEVLRDQGVEVIVVDTMVEVEAAVDGGKASTLLVDDSRALLGEARYADLLAIDSAKVVLLDPAQEALDAFLPGVRRAGMGTDPSGPADCALPAATGLESITGRSALFELAESGSVAGCFPTPSGLVRIAATGSVVAFGPIDLLTNAAITEAGNAALALRVLGAEPRLIWYRPGIADAEVVAPPTIGDLSPDWVVPVALLLVATFVAAAVWRGRRMGPLIVEPLPSIVPADETVRGRARMYARASARLRAADALRLGTLDRIGRELGQPMSAGVEAIVIAAAAATRRPAGEIRDLLRDALPGDDASLLRLSGELLRLERELTRVTRPHEAGE